MRRAALSILSLFLFFEPLLVHAQTNFRVSGRVVDSAMRSPLQGATLRIVGMTLGTTTNADGRYILLLAEGEYKMTVTFIGFDPDTVEFRVASRDTTLNVDLRQSEVSLPEVVIYPDTVNPADEIIRKAIQAKEKWLGHLASYSFDAYTKTVMRVVQDKNKSDTTIGGILETQTKGYWKEPDSYLELVTAKRQTANFTQAQNVFTAGRVINFNKNIVRIDRYSIPGPTSPEALEFYKFTVEDTLFEGSTRVFRIIVEPRDDLSLLFKGHIDITDRSFALAHARLSLADPTALSPLEGIVYDEQFAEYDDIYWLPIEIRTTFSVKILPLTPRIFFENTSVMYDYSVNRIFPQEFFERKTERVIADASDSSSWGNAQILPLTDAEVLAYARLDSITRNLSFFWKSFLFFTKLATQPGPAFLTSISDFYHFNRVEGSYIGVGLTSSTLVDGTTLTLIAGRGFADKIWKYDLGVAYRLPFWDGVSVGGTYFRRMTNREEENIYSRFEITLGALLYKDDYRDYYMSKGWEAHVSWRAIPQVKLGIKLADDYEASVHNRTDYSIFSRQYEFSINPLIDDGRMRSIEISAKFDTRSAIGMGMSLESDEGRSYWLGDAAAEFSSPQFLNSSFSFGRYRVSLERHQMTFASGFVNLWLTCGTSIGRLPIQRMFELQAAYGGYAVASVLSTLSAQRLLSARSAVLGIEYNLPNSFFRWTRIPLVRDTWFDLVVFAHGAATSSVMPMGEAGFGLVNIIPFIRTDFTWGVAGLCKGFAWTLETTLDI